MLGRLRCWIFLVPILAGISALATDVRYLTYSGRIVDDVGSPLNGSVQFNIKISNTAGTCVLWEENLTDNLTAGVFSLQIGRGTVVFDGFGSGNISGVFKQGIALNCKDSTPTASVSPLSTEDRNMAVAFNDGTGWQSMANQIPIRSVPYALYAQDVANLVGYPIAVTAAPTNGQVLQFQTGTNSWVPTTIATGTFTGVSSIANTGGSITLAPQVAAGSVLINSGTASVGTGSGALVVTGGIGTSGDINSAASINATTTMSAQTSVLTPQLYGSSVASGNIKIDGTSHATKGNVLLATAGGNVGIGTATPTGVLDVAGGTSTSGAGYPIKLIAQTAVQSGGTGYNGGDVILNGGNGYSSGSGGSVILTAGRGNFSSGAEGFGGSLSLGPGGGGGDAGGVVMSAGAGNNGHPSGATFTMSTTAFSGNGGSIALLGGNSNSLDTNGGDIKLDGGLPNGSGKVGNILLGSVQGNVGVGTTTPATALDVAGEIRVGNTSSACSVANKGSIRYNNASSVLEFCNGTAWSLIQAAACSDATPDMFSFSDQANATASTLYTSDIVAITGINCTVPVSVSGGGSPQFQICSDSGCSTVVQGWTSSPSSVVSGQYLQARLTTDAVGGSQFQATFIVGSTATVWTVTNAGGDCTGTPTIGTVCADGTLYAGLSPDGNVKMFTTRCDAGQTWDGVSTCTGSRSGLSWNNGTSNYITTGISGNTTGKSNSAALAVLVDAGAAYVAAQYCESLNINGKTDWYLPALTELNVLYNNRASLRNFELTGNIYWSSTENDNAYAWFERFSDGMQNYNLGQPKHRGLLVRCVRR